MYTKLNIFFRIIKYTMNYKQQGGLRATLAHMANKKNQQKKINNCIV